MSEQTATGVPRPTVGGVREQVGRFAELWLGGMFLQPQAYAYERDKKNPLGNGLVYLAIIGVLVALGQLVGTALRFATSPSGDAIKNIVLAHLQSLPFYVNLDSATATQFDRGYEQVWNQLGPLFLGYPVDAAGFISPVLGLLFVPLGLILSYLIYAGLVHLIARRWNPETSYSELFAPLTLAASPQLIYLIGIFPGGFVSGTVVALWSFICSIFAIRIAYQTTTRNAVWAAVFPMLVFILLAVVLLFLVSWFTIVNLTGGRQ